MQVVITGCGRTGRALATRLDAEGDEVTVIELDDTVKPGCPPDSAAGSWRGTASIRACSRQPASRMRKHSSPSRRTTAPTSSPPGWPVTPTGCPMSWRVCTIPLTAPVYTEFGIATVGSVQTIVNRLIQMLHHRTLEPHQTFGNAETLLVRSRVPAYLAGRRVAEFNVPGEIGVVELSRAGHSSIPEPSTPLADGDVLSFIVAAASLGRLRSFLGGKWS